MRMKYVMVDNRFPIVFGEAMTHASFKAMNHQYMKGEITSAGFVSVAPDGDNVQATAYGRSESLNLSAGLNDSEIITKMLNPSFFF